MWALSSLLLLTLGIAQGLIRLDPLVETQQGLIRGLRVDDGDYSIFLGIPFAQVNNSNPFGASSPQPKFDQVFEAYDNSAVCPQSSGTGITSGTIDCLHLNIYVPNKASSANKLPVMVWIYGGGFMMGAANMFSPKYFVKHDIIFVSLNYRVGPYGFMCLNIPEVPGNQGLKDQLLALRWVKNNIASFGGNVNKITIIGHSAGSASVEHHIVSNKENLFSQGIMQSLSVLTPGSLVEADVEVPMKISERLGFQTEDVYEALAFLSNTDSSLVVGASNDLGLDFKVCVEKEFEDAENFLTEHPLNLDYSKVKNLPILAGFNSQEDIRKYSNKNVDYYKNLDVFGILQMIFDYDEEFQIMEDLMRHFYIGDEDLSEAVWWALANFGSDFEFNYPIQKSLEKFVESGSAHVYQYVVSYSGENSTEGVAHGDELQYLFDSFDGLSPSTMDQLVINRMTTLWSNFVKYGEPTPETTELLPVKWTPMTKDAYNYLDIGAELKMDKRLYHDRMAFWELFYKVNENKLKAKRYD